MRVNFLHPHLARARLTAQFGSAQSSSLDSRLDDSARLGSRHGSDLFEISLGFARDPALLCSRSGSALFEVRLCFVRGHMHEVRLGWRLGSSQIRARVTATRFDSASLGSARLGSACYLILGSFGVLTQALRLWLWARKSARCSARLNSG